MNKLLIVVDMINGFINEGLMHDTRINKITPTITKLIKNFSKEKTYFVTDSHKEDAIEFESFPKHCLEGSRESLVIDDLQEYICDNHIILKNSVNSFFNFYKKDILKDNDIYIVGCCTDICVLQFSLTLLAYINENNLNNKVFVVKDAVDTFNNDNHIAEIYNNMALAIISTNGVRIVESKDIV